MTDLAEPARRTRRLPAGYALVASLLCGGGLLVSFPPYGLWWCAPLAVALLAVAVRGRGVAAAGGLGWLAGCVFFIPLLSWAGTQVGAWPWLLLSCFEAVYLGLLGGAGAYMTPLFARWRWSWPLGVGLLWVAEEALRSRTPFGGFPWGRLAFSQADAPTLGYAALGGAPAVTFAVGLAGGLVAAAAWRLAAERLGWHGAGLGGGGRSVVAGRPGRWVRAAALVIGAVVVFGLGVLVSAPRAGQVVGIAVIQGNVPRLGLGFNAQRRAVLDNHVAGTLELARRVDAGLTARPVLVVWPENSSDIDPLLNADARAAVDSAALAIAAPILVGAVLVQPDGRVRNAGLLWLPGVGPVQQYTKRHPVPFAEYIPLRTFMRSITRKVDLVRSDFVGGDRPGVMTVPVTGGNIRVGDVICFEVAYDAIVRDTVTGGAQVLITQTNNATFDRAEAEQQLAMVRLRSVEHGRPGLMASTVGVSGLVSTDGRVHQATGFNTPAVVTGQIHLGTTRTPATRLGGAPEAALTGLALFGLVAAWMLRRRGVAPHTDEEEA